MIRRHLASTLIMMFGVALLAACGREAVHLSTSTSSPSNTAGTSPSPELTTSPAVTKAPEATGTSTPPEPTAIPSGGSGVEGTVLAGPTCPVERPDMPCPDRPVPDAVVKARTPSGHVVGETRTDKQGEFKIELAGGSYDIAATSDAVFGCSSERVLVASNRYTHVRISCDTGIR